MTVRALLLTRQGLVFVPPRPGRAGPLQAGPGEADPTLVQGLELELAELGYTVSYRLRQALSGLSVEQLTELRAWSIAALAQHIGAAQKHVPLFRKFPDGVPKDTGALWWKKVLTHYLQEQDQPCLSCKQTGTTHVLKPCAHVVCEVCWDGANYSACPVCEHHVDTSSPFFKPSDIDRSLSPKETVRFKLLDLGQDEHAEARRLFQSFCARPQALSPTDLDALRQLVIHYKGAILPWVPETIPVRENRAHIFGTLLRLGDPLPSLATAAPHLSTATDVLRLIAVYSFADPGLQPQNASVPYRPDKNLRWDPLKRQQNDALLARWSKDTRFKNVVWSVCFTTRRFKPAKMARPLRRALLALLEGMNPEAVLEDMKRHAPVWVRVGEVLHPFEYKDRFPNTARAFAAVRRTRADSPLGQALRAAPGPALTVYSKDRLGYEGFASRTERLFREADVPALCAHLGARPGELGRRLDQLLSAGHRQDPQRLALAADTLLARVPRLTTPMLLSLSTALPRRDKQWPVRVFFPRGNFFVAPSRGDGRTPLPADTLNTLSQAIEQELLARLAQKPRFEAAVLDGRLAQIMVPFNERTASRSAVNLPRGSWLDIPRSKLMRMFCHWCEPKGSGNTTDIDLSIGFYDPDWKYLDVCSYYQLECVRKGVQIARSSGDLRDAPFPDGASEFVDLDIEAALKSGVRYAAMIVNNYAGLPFSMLERGFAGLMLRNDPWGAFFDPRTVALKFAIDGDNGVFLPLIVDLKASRLFWLDASHEGEIAFNNVANSSAAVERISKACQGYFGHGVRPSMLRLAALHAAARCDTVFVRDELLMRFTRHAGESPYALYKRIEQKQADDLLEALPPVTGPTFAALLQGDIPLPEGSEVYALFREGITRPLAASDLLG